MPYLCPTTAMLQSAAILCSDLEVRLGRHLGLEHYVAAVEEEPPMAGVYWASAAEGPNFQVDEVKGPWKSLSLYRPRLQHLLILQDQDMENAYRINCLLDALELGVRLQLRVDTQKVYDWFRYAGYVRWAEYMIQELKRTSVAHFVDLGGGSGWLSALVKAAVPWLHVTYTDVSLEALHFAQRDFDENGLKVETRQGDLFQALEGEAEAEEAAVAFSYPPQVAPSAAQRGSPEVALAVEDPMHYLRRFCREAPVQLAWLGVTWELLEETIASCCRLGWQVQIVEQFLQDVSMPATLLELRQGLACSAQALPRERLYREGRLQEAAERQHPAAMVRYAMELMQQASTTGGDQAFQQHAIRWYQRAAKLGETSAQTRLGFLYLTGDGVKKDEEKGLKLLWRAAAQGEAAAMFGLAETFALAGRPEAITWYRRSARLGWREAKRQLGLYLLSLNIEAEEAREMLWEAASEGDLKAAQLLKDYFQEEL